MSTDRKYCVYVHLKESSGTPFYVGKGSRKRAMSFLKRSAYWNRIAAKYGRTVRIVGWFPEECAFTLEKILIHKIGRKNLCNMTDGGEGCSGRKANPETLKKASERLRGKPLPESVREAQRMSQIKPVGTACGLRFKSVTEAAEYANPGNPKSGKVCISFCANGKMEKAYGYKWGYLDDKGVPVFLYVNRMSQRRPARHIAVQTTCGLRFDSLTDATSYLVSVGFKKANAGAICRACKKPSATAYGYGWSYV